MNVIGATDELSLRVSVATLVQVVFTAEDNQQMLALERKATFNEHDQGVVVKAQPFGGAVRINNPSLIHKISGGFHFDSERSRAEQDFRILIHPSAWEEVKEFCLEQFQSQSDAALETSPRRELTEEFLDSLGILINPDQYICNPLWTVIENNPAPTANIHAENQPTVRMYRVFEARITDQTLWQMIKLNSENFSDQELRQRVSEDRRHGGRGRANACTILPLQTLRQFCLSLPLHERALTTLFDGMALEKNVLALLEGVAVKQFQLIKS